MPAAFVNSYCTRKFRSEDMYIYIYIYNDFASQSKSHIYIYIYIYIQDVPGGMCQTSGECSLC